MSGRRAWIAVAAALVLALASAPLASAQEISASVSSTPAGQPMPPGFLGVSFEYRAMHQYTGRDPLAIDPVLLALLQGLAPGQSPVIRIGGDSTDGTWWPIRGVIPPGGIYYPLTAGWMRTAHALAADLSAKLILGINLAAGRPGLAATEGRALLAGIGAPYIDAFEIGNEPDLYGAFPWYRDRRGHVYWARGHKYDLKDYAADFGRWARALPRSVPLAGPATSGPAWMSGLGRFIASEPRLGLVTYHRYPLRACVTSRRAPGFASIPNLLSDASETGLAQGVAGYVRAAHAHHLPFRIGEINSASCEGAAGVSDTFGSALWALDTMFAMASVGVDGVNFHMLPGSHYELFTISQQPSGTWQAFVHPEYYGLQMFAQAFPPGASLLPVSAPAGPVKVWATRDPTGVTRVTIINQDTLNAHEVSVTLPAPPPVASLETLTAPGVTATSGVSLGGQSYGAETTTGSLPGPLQTNPIAPQGNTYTVTVPPASAALLTGEASALPPA